MKKLVDALLPLLLLAGCVSPNSTPTTPTTPPSPISMPPLPPGLETRLAKTSARAVAAPMMVTMIQEPALPYVARTASIVVTNQPIFKLTVRYDANVYGFGVAYSDDLVNWVSVGESRWTNSTVSNPFLEPGTTEHRVWVGEPQWQIMHVPDATTNNCWRIVLTDYTAGQAKRFYVVYPLEGVIGLPYQ